MSLTVSGYITRAELALPDLQLEDPGTYRIVTAGPGALTWERDEVDSPYLHGRMLVRARKDIVSASLSIRAYGSSLTQLESRAATLLRAFEQFSYSLVLTINGQAHEWKCQPADYAPNDNGEWDKFALMAFQQVYRFNVPRQPNAVQGAF